MGSLLGLGIYPLVVLAPKVENSGRTLSLPSRASRIGRLFCGVEHTGGVDPLPLDGTTTLNGDLPLLPNLPEFLPSVAA